MRVAEVVLVGALAAALAACGVTISQINARPDRYYQHPVDFTGRIARLQALPDTTLLEVVDPRGSRILVRAASPEAVAGDWVRVHGILVPETRVGEALLYDVVVAERVKRTHAPRLANLI
jgi:hypothetical protein